MTDAPADLIQEALDIISSDRTDVRVTCQASARMGGFVAQWDARAIGIQHGGLPQLIVADLRPAREPVEAGARSIMEIPFANIIEIQTI